VFPVIYSAGSLNFEAAAADIRVARLARSNLYFLHTYTNRVFNDLIDDFTKLDFKSFWDDFEIFKIILKYGDFI
jgi:hypothetical protein